MTSERPLIGIDPAAPDPQIILTDYGNAQPRDVWGAEYAEIMRRLESAEGINGLRVWVNWPRERLDVRRLIGERLAEMLDCLMPWPGPDQDEFGLAVPEYHRLCWEWQTRREPLTEASTCTHPPHDRHPAPGPDASPLDRVQYCIDWSRRQMRTPPDQRTTWDQVRDRLPYVWQLRAGMPVRMPDELGDRAWRQLAEGRFTAPASQEEADQWERDRKNAKRHPVLPVNGW